MPSTTDLDHRPLLKRQVPRPNQQHKTEEKTLRYRFKMAPSRHPPKMVLIHGIQDGTTAHIPTQLMADSNYSLHSTHTVNWEEATSSDDAPPLHHRSLNNGIPEQRASLNNDTNYQLQSENTTNSENTYTAQTVPSSTRISHLHYDRCVCLPSSGDDIVGRSLAWNHKRHPSHQQQDGPIAYVQTIFITRAAITL